MSKRISISIVVYKNYADVKLAVESIEKYTTSINKIIYLIDNGVDSMDKDYSEFIEFTKIYDDVVYINTKSNLGFGKGHNYIIDTIDSDYHAIINPDILLVEDSLTKIVEFMDENKNCGMVIPKIIDPSGNLQKVYRKEPTIFDMFVRMFLKNLFTKRFNAHTLQEKNFEEVFKVPFGQGSFLVIRTQLFKQLRGFDDRYFMYMEDADLCKRVNEVSNFLYYPYTKVIHKWEKGSHRNKTLFKYHVQSMIKYFNKWGYKFY